jgi:hypothetical protein
MLAIGVCCYHRRGIREVQQKIVQTCLQRTALTKIHGVTEQDTLGPFLHLLKDLRTFGVAAIVDNYD